MQHSSAKMCAAKAPTPPVRIDGSVLPSALPVESPIALIQILLTSSPRINAEPASIPSDQSTKGRSSMIQPSSVPAHIRGEMRSIELPHY
jgi:hypothetical protein